MKLKKQIEANNRELEKVYKEGGLNKLVNNKTFDEDQVHQVERNEEFGGCFPRKVGSQIVYLFI